MLPVVLALALAGSAPPCGPLDLETAQALALARSDEVAIKRAEVLMAEADRSIAGAVRWLPSVTATVLFGPSPRAKGDINDPTSYTGNPARTLFIDGLFVRAEVNAVQPLWTWGQLDGARDAADAGVKARRHLVQNQAREIHQRVRQLFYAAVLTKKLLAVGADVESALDEVDKRVVESLAAGDGEIAPQDKYRVAIFRSEVRQKKAEGVKAMFLARAGLAGVLAIEEPRLVLADGALPEVKDPVPELAASITEAIALRPDLLALDQALVAKRAQLDAAHGAQLPQLFVAGNFTYAGATNRDPQSNPWAYDPLNSLGAGVALGLSQNLAIPLMLAQSEKLEAELQPLLRQRDGLARLVRFEVEQAHAELVMAAEKAAAAKSALGSGKAWFRSAGLDFGLNVTDARTLLDAYSGYVKTQLDAAQANYEYLVARGRLDQVIGKAVPEGAASCGLD